MTETRRIFEAGIARGWIHLPVPVPALTLTAACIKKGRPVIKTPAEAARAADVAKCLSECVATRKTLAL